MSRHHHIQNSAPHPKVKALYLLSGMALLLILATILLTNTFISFETAVASFALFVGLLLLVPLILLIIWKPIWSVFILLFMIFAQDFLIMLTSVFIPSGYFSFAGNTILLFKEVLVLVTTISFIIIRITSPQKITYPDWFAIILMGWLGLYLVLPNSLLGGFDVSLVSKITALRSLSILVVLYFMGRWLPLRTPKDLDSVIKLLFAMGLLSFIVGIVLILLPDSAWQAMGISELYKLKLTPEGYDAMYRAGVLPGSFFVWDIPGFPIRRMSSLIVEPIQTGFVFATLFLLATSLSSRHRITPRMLVFGLATLLALSRGGLFLAGLGYLFMRIKRPKFVTLFGVITATVIVAFFSLVWQPLFGETGTSRRVGTLVLGLTTSFRHPLGYGLGTTDYLSIIRSGSTSLLPENLDSSVSESFIGTFGTSTGLVGIALFLGFMLALTIHLFRIWQKHKQQEFVLSRAALGMSGAIMALIVVGILSASGYGFVGIGIVFVLSGLIVNTATHTEQRQTNDQNSWATPDQ